jgi:preprotein translocase subunit SecE
MISKAFQFSREVKTELQKATWPWDPKEKGMKKYRELVDSTLIVLIGMLLMSGYVSFWDFVMVNVVGALTK